jgi:hypothetical protein
VPRFGVDIKAGLMSGLFVRRGKWAAMMGGVHLCQGIAAMNLSDRLSLLSPRPWMMF